MSRGKGDREGTVFWSTGEDVVPEAIVVAVVGAVGIGHG